ncbi:MAG TPA: FAD-dependent oxidoreductase [Longimicrobiales bacterium]|nr:FAD-dependent oxidoreductase [Longimicrobiales bacterium]
MTYSRVFHTIDRQARRRFIASRRGRGRNPEGIVGEQSSEVTGPDLRIGVPLKDLPMGEVLGGHVDDEPVLLYRDADGVWAVSGVCTHYSAPLVQGLAEGAVIRCPWHHACFSMRRGEALAAPALNALRRWRTRVADGHVRVLEPIDDSSVAVTAIRRNSESVVIIGAGAAGSAAAETLRREGYSGAVTLVDPDLDAPYDRPNLSKDYLAGNAPEEWLPLRTNEFYERQGIERRTAGAVSIDLGRRRVLLSTGEHLSFNSLVVATGGRPVEPQLPGSTSDHVHVLRSLDDCRRLIESAKAAQRVVIVGASFIGMEAAAALRQRDLEVAVVAPEQVPFERSLGPELGTLLKSVHEEHGVSFHMERTLAAVHEHRVELDDGSFVDADLVLLGVGVRPRVDLLEEAGLGTAEGVAVDRFLETRVKGVYAAGDIAYYPEVRAGRNVRVEHWVVAQRQGQTVARNIMGRHIAFTDVPFFWTQQYDLSIRYVGHARSWDAVNVIGSLGDRDCAVHFMSEGKVRAVATVGRDRECLEVERCMEVQGSKDGGLPADEISSRTARAGSSSA